MNDVVLPVMMVAPPTSVVTTYTKPSPPSRTSTSFMSGLSDDFDDDGTMDEVEQVLNSSKTFQPNVAVIPNPKGVVVGIGGIGAGVMVGNDGTMNNNNNMRIVNTAVVAPERRPPPPTTSSSSFDSGIQRPPPPYLGDVTMVLEQQQQQQGGENIHPLSNTMTSDNSKEKPLPVAENTTTMTTKTSTTPSSSQAAAAATTTTTTVPPKRHENISFYDEDEYEDDEDEGRIRISTHHRRSEPPARQQEEQNHSNNNDHQPNPNMMLNINQSNHDNNNDDVESRDTLTHDTMESATFASATRSFQDGTLDDDELDEEWSMDRRSRHQQQNRQDQQQQRRPQPPPPRLSGMEIGVGNGEGGGNGSGSGVDTRLISKNTRTTTTGTIGGSAVDQLRPSSSRQQQQQQQHQRPPTAPPRGRGAAVVHNGKDEDDEDDEELIMMGMKPKQHIRSTSLQQRPQPKPRTRSTPPQQRPPLANNSTHSNAATPPTISSSWSTVQAPNIDGGTSLRVHQQLRSPSPLSVSSQLSYESRESIQQQRRRKRQEQMNLSIEKIKQQQQIQQQQQQQQRQQQWKPPQLSSSTHPPPTGIKPSTGGIKSKAKQMISHTTRRLSSGFYDGLGDNDDDNIVPDDDNDDDPTDERGNSDPTLIRAVVTTATTTNNNTALATSAQRVPQPAGAVDELVVQPEPAIAAQPQQPTLKASPVVPSPRTRPSSSIMTMEDDEDTQPSDEPLEEDDDEEQEAGHKQQHVESGDGCDDVPSTSATAAAAVAHTNGINQQQDGNNNNSQGQRQDEEEVLDNEQEEEEDQENEEVVEEEEQEEVEEEEQGEGDEGEEEEEEEEEEEVESMSEKEVEDEDDEEEDEEEEEENSDMEQVQQGQELDEQEEVTEEQETTEEEQQEESTSIEQGEGIEATATVVNKAAKVDNKAATSQEDDEEEEDNKTETSENANVAAKGLRRNNDDAVVANDEGGGGGSNTDNQGRSQQNNGNQEEDERSEEEEKEGHGRDSSGGGRRHNGNGRDDDDDDDDNRRRDGRQRNDNDDDDEDDDDEDDDEEEDEDDDDDDDKEQDGHRGINKPLQQTPGTVTTNISGSGPYQRAAPPPHGRNIPPQQQHPYGSTRPPPPPPPQQQQQRGQQPSQYGGNHQQQHRGPPPPPHRRPPPPPNQQRVPPPSQEAGPRGGPPPPTHIGPPHPPNQQHHVVTDPRQQQQYQQQLSGSQMQRSYQQQQATSDVGDIPMKANQEEGAYPPPNRRPAYPPNHPQNQYYQQGQLQQQQQGGGPVPTNQLPTNQQYRNANDPTQQVRNDPSRPNSSSVDGGINRPNDQRPSPQGLTSSQQGRHQEQARHQHKITKGQDDKEESIMIELSDHEDYNDEAVAGGNQKNPTQVKDVKRDEQQKGGTNATGAGLTTVQQTNQQKKNSREGTRPSSRDQESSGMSSSTICLCCCCCFLIVAIVIILVILLPDGDVETSDRDEIILQDLPTASPVTGDVDAPINPQPTASPVQTIPPSSLKLPWILSGGPFNADGPSGFGFSAAIDGNIIALGAPLLNEGAVDSFYRTPDGEWLELSVQGEENESGFGSSVAITGRTMIVGAPNLLARNAPTPTGGAYVYRFNRVLSRWQSVGETIRGVEEIFEANEEFGSAVAVSSNYRAIIGAPLNNNNFQNGIGRVYTFDVSDETPIALEQNPIYGSQAGDNLGFSVAISKDGSRFMAGAPGGDTGYATIYSWVDDDWQILATLQGTEPGEEFGSHVEVLSSRTFAVGAPGYHGGSGRIMVFEELDDGTVSVVGPSSGIVGETQEALGKARTMSGGDDENGLSIIAGTAAGDVRRFDLHPQTMLWSERYETVQTNFPGGISSLSSTDDSSFFVAATTADLEAVIYEATPAPGLGIAVAPSPAPTSRPTFPPRFSTWFLVGGPYTSGVSTDVGFGKSVAIVGSVAAAGAPDALGAGGVLTYEKDDGTDEWTEGKQVFGEEPGGSFGESIHLTSTGLLVGAPMVLVEGTPTDSGAAYYYTYEQGNWIKLGSTIRGATDIFAAREEFGASVASTSDGARLVIGAPGSSLDGLSSRGRMYVYEYNTDWTLTADFAGQEENERFGSSVDISTDGTVFMVGSPGRGTGFASVYRFDGTEWIAAARLDGVDNGEGMGSSVKIISTDGSMVAAGGPGFNGDSGRVVVYQLDSSGEYQQLGPDLVGEVGDRIGAANTLAGSASFPSIILATASGLVKRFDNDPGSGDWLPLVKVYETGTSGVAISAGPQHGTFIAGGDEVVSIFEVGSE